MILKKICSIYILTGLWCTAVPINTASRRILTVGKIVGGIASIGLPIKKSILDLYPATITSTSPAPKNVDEWVKKQLKKNGMPESKKITVVTHPTIYGYNLYFDTIIINTKKAKKLSNALTSKKKNQSKKIILRAQSSVNHECGHLVLNHQKKISGANALFGLFSHLAWHYTLEGARKRFFAPTIFINGIFSVAHLYSFNLKNKTRIFLNSWYSRRCEREADEYAFSHARKPQELQLKRDFYRNRHFLLVDAWNKPNDPSMKKLFENNKQFARNYFLIQQLYRISGSTKPFGEWVTNYPLLVKYIEYTRAASHPLDSERAQAADRALKKFIHTK